MIIMQHNSHNKILFQSSLNFRCPSDKSWQTHENWLNYRKEYDGAEGLWRVHNNLYDLTNFVNQHPGGKMWLNLTKGIDITEAFETHHFSTKPNDILATYFIRPARTGRNSPFTFEDDGFYRTLKRRVIPILGKIPKKSITTTDIMTDALCIGTFLFAILAARSWSYILGYISGMLLCCTAVASHNYFHKKDNFRMHYFELAWKDFVEWRITHVLSHHLFPNTILDCEMRVFEPYIDYTPKRKTWMVKYGSWLLVICIWFAISSLIISFRITNMLNFKKAKEFYWTYYIVPFILPTTMYLTSDQTLFATIGMWLFIMECEGFLFGVIGFNAGHRHPEIFHDGDSPWPNTKHDWGLHQLDTVADRYDIKQSEFLVLTSYGNHALHHLFPTLDHGLLKHLDGALKEVMKEFGVDLRLKSQLQMMKGMFLQMSKEVPRGPKEKIQ